MLWIIPRHGWPVLLGVTYRTVSQWYNGARVDVISILVVIKCSIVLYLIVLIFGGTLILRFSKKRQIKVPPKFSDVKIKWRQYWFSLKLWGKAVMVKHNGNFCVFWVNVSCVAVGKFRLIIFYYQISNTNCW